MKQLDLYDASRKRSVPLLAYSVPTNQGNNGLVLLSHGHAFPNTDYSFLVKALVLQGH